MNYWILGSAIGLVLLGLLILWRSSIGQSYRSTPKPDAIKHYEEQRDKSTQHHRSDEPEEEYDEGDEEEELELKESGSGNIVPVISSLVGATVSIVLGINIYGTLQTSLAQMNQSGDPNAQPIMAMMPIMITVSFVIIGGTIIYTTLRNTLV